MSKSKPGQRIKTSVGMWKTEAERIKASAVADKRDWTKQLVVLAIECLDRREAVAK